MEGSGVLSSSAVRILVIGDSGVGKTSLLQLLCSGEVIREVEWTVGSASFVYQHIYQSISPIYIEFSDIGGSSLYSISRHVYYSQPFDGIMVVFDQSNYQSYRNLSGWISEIAGHQPWYLLYDYKQQKHSSINNNSSSSMSSHYISSSGGGGGNISSSSSSSSSSYLTVVIGQRKIPIIVIGCKSDLMNFQLLLNRSSSSSSSSLLSRIFPSLSLSAHSSSSGSGGGSSGNSSGGGGGGGGGGGNENEKIEIIRVSSYDSGMFGEMTYEGAKIRAFFDHVIDLKLTPLLFAPLSSLPSFTFPTLL